MVEGVGIPGAPGSRSVVTASNVPDPQKLFAELGVELDAELTVLALTHRSFAYEHGGLPTNERLEFLGDSVLGIVVTEALYHDHPTLPEGRLAKLRASIVNMHALAGVGRRMGLGDLLRLGRGEELTGGRDKASIVADAVEAVLGAVYLQHGLDVARTVVVHLFAGLMADAPTLGAGLDWKTSLQELSASRNLGVPEYRVTEEGPDHAKMFAAAVHLSGVRHGAGAGRTKKEAEQQAASAAFTALDSARPTDTSIVDLGAADLPTAALSGAHFPAADLSAAGADPVADVAAAQPAAGADPVADLAAAKPAAGADPVADLAAAHLAAGADPADPLDAGRFPAASRSESSGA